MIDVNDKLNNSKIRLEDCLSEMSRKTLTNFESSKDGSEAALNTVRDSLIKSQNDIQNQICHLSMLTDKKFHATKQSFIQKLKNTDQLNLENFQTVILKLEKLLAANLINFANVIETVTKLDYRNELIEIKKNISDVDFKMIKFQKDIDMTHEVIFFSNSSLKYSKKLYDSLCKQYLL